MLGRTWKFALLLVATPFAVGCHHHHCFRGHFWHYPRNAMPACCGSCCDCCYQPCGDLPVAIGAPLVAPDGLAAIAPETTPAVMPAAASGLPK